MPDYDSPWKEMLDAYFPDFMAFFFPEAPTTLTGRGAMKSGHGTPASRARCHPETRLADKLMKVWRRDGAEQMVLIHRKFKATGIRVFPSACMCITLPPV